MGLETAYVGQIHAP